MRVIIIICFLGLSTLYFSSCRVSDSDELPKIEWESVSQFSGQDLEGIARDYDGTIYIVYNEGFYDETSLYKSINGNTWEKIDATTYHPETGNNSSQFGNISGIGVNNDRIYIGSSLGDIFVKGPQDTVFSRTLNSAGDDIVQFTFYENQIFASGLRNGLYHSKDNGGTWQSILANQVNFDDYVEVSSSSINSNGVLFVGTTTLFGDLDDDSYVLSSASPFSDWRVLRSGKGAENSINYLLIDGNDNILAGTEYGGILYSFDNGESWSEPDTRFFQTVTDLEINSKGNIFASVFTRDSMGANSPEYSIYRSSTISGKWESIGFDNFGAIKQMIMADDGVLFIATRNGLFKTLGSTIDDNR